MNKKIQKILALILILSLMLSMFTANMFVTTSAAATNVWSGNVIAPTVTDSQGNILIRKAEELAYIIKYGGGAGNTYKLTTDIYLNDVSTDFWTDGYAYNELNQWFERSQTSGSFSGTIDGAGHIIYGLYHDSYSHTGTFNGSALIPRVANGDRVTIKNLGIDKAYIWHPSNASAFVAVAEQSGPITIENCFAGKNVTLYGSANAGAFRAYAKNAQGGSISNCYSLATVGGGAYGLLGTVWDSPKMEINSTFNANGPVSISNNPGYNCIATDCYATVYSSSTGSSSWDVKEGVTVISAANMKGTDVFTNAAKMPQLMSCQAFLEVNNDYPMLKVFVNPGEDNSDTFEYWNGEVVQPTFTDKEGNILIRNASEFAYIISTGGNADKTYKLTSDIYLNDINKVNWKTGAVTNGYAVKYWYDYTKAFQGTIDGDGHVVHGLYSNTTPATTGPYGSALIPSVVKNSSATIKNLGVDNSYIRNHNASAFVAANESSAFIMDNCYAGENVTLTGLYAGAFRAYAKNAYGSSVTNCYSLATVNGSAQSGLFGLFWDASNSLVISNCYNSTGPISTHGGNGQADASNNYAAVSGAFTEGVTVISVDNMKGIDVFTDAAKMPNLNLSGKYTATQGYPYLSVFEAPEEDNSYEKEPVQIWNGKHDTAPVDLDDDNIYEITNGEELAWVIATGNASGYNYKLTNDIYLNDITKVNWKTGVVDADYTVNKWFDEYWNKGNTVMFAGGTIDGQGHVIYGLYWEGMPASYDENNAGTGLIPVIAKDAAKTTIINLGIDCAYMNHQRSASAFVGVQRDNTVLEMDSCFAGVNVTLKAADAGAFRGYARNTAGGSITNCYSLASITGTVKHGLIGMIWENTNLVIENCYNANGPVSSHNNSGNVASANNYESYDDNYDGSKNVLAEGVTSIYAAYMQGADVFTNTDKMSGMDTSKYVAVSDNYPELTSFWKLSAEKDGKNYVGKQYDDITTYFANTADNTDYFYRYNKILLNKDDTMDIGDLVYMTQMIKKSKNIADIDKDGSTTYEDAAILRKALIGISDYAEPFSAKTYQINNSNLSGVYTYVWGDEFDGSGLDYNNWSTETKMGGRDVLTVETTKQTTNVNGGNLTLTAYKDGAGNYHVPNSVHTKGTMNYKYGYVEIRAKLSQEVGSFASFWTRSVSDASAPTSLINGTLDHYAEVDMFETFQKNGVQKVGGNILKNFPGQDKSWYATAMTNTQQYAFGDEEYHVYGYEWTPYEINLYIDGVLYAKLDITETWTATTTEGKGMDGWNTVARVDETETGMESFHEAQYLIFNHHLHYAGAFTASTSVTENEDFSSAEYVIDYCRVYQVQSQGEFASLK